MKRERGSSGLSNEIAHREADRITAQIVTFNAHGEPERRALKYRAMCASSFALFRGTAHLV